MIAGFGAKVVKDVTGVSRMQLEHWDRTGIVRPSKKLELGKDRGENTPSRTWFNSRSPNDSERKGSAFRKSEKPWNFCERIFQI